MKTLITAIFTLFVITTQAQTNNSQTKQSSPNNEITAISDVLLSVPMIGNIELKNCSVELQKALIPLTVLKAIKTTKIYEEQSVKTEEMLADRFDELDEIEMPLQ